jgi:hypothetical protein
MHPSQYVTSCEAPWRKHGAELLRASSVFWALLRLRRRSIFVHFPDSADESDNETAITRAVNLERFRTFDPAPIPCSSATSVAG